MADIKNALSDRDLTLDYHGKHLISHKDVLAAIVKVLFPDDFLNMPIEEIIESHLETNTFNNDFIELKAEEVHTHEGKQTRFDLHFNVKTKSGETVVVVLEIQRQRSGDEIVRAIVYPAKIAADQNHKDYKDFNKIISSWINLNPLAEYRNTIIVSEMYDSLLEINDDHYSKTLLTEKPSDFDLIKVVQFNIGGPEYPNFKGLIKLLYDLFHNNQEEVHKFYQSEGIDFNMEDIFNSMMEYKTLDEQVREEGRLEGREEGIQEGRKEGRLEGREEGIQEGINKSSIEAAQRMLNDNLSFDSILTYLPNLTIEALNSLQKEIQTS